MALILVVDDDESQRFLVSHTLLHSGHEVVQAENGRDAFELFNKVQPKLVVTDIQMPFRDGLDLIYDIRHTDLDVPIIAMSSGTASLLERAKELGASQCIAKSGDMDFLLDEVEKLLRNG